MGNSPLQFTTFKKCIEEIFRLNHIAHLKITSLPETNHGRSLTKRQREVLQWVADGKTIQDIATIMGLSLATIEKHLKLARDALNVRISEIPDSDYANSRTAVSVIPGQFGHG